jgi:hypothetical protein
MGRVKVRGLATVGGLLLAGFLASGGAAEAELPSLDSPELGHGPYAYMQMLLQKTFLRINVATIEVRVDKPTENRLAGLAAGKQYSEGLAAELANVAIAAERAVVQMKFRRDVSLNRWMGVVRENLEQARKAGLIDAALEQKVGGGLPDSFAALKSRGYEKNDRLIYGVLPDSLRTVVVSASGQVLIDRTDRDPGTRRVVMASYFAFGSEFREPLLRSLLKTGR